MKRKIAIILLILLVSGLSRADASFFRDAVHFISKGESVGFQIRPEMKKMPQFSEERTGQLNQLLQHISIRGSIEAYQSQISFLLDDHTLFSYYDISGQDGEYSLIVPDGIHYYRVPPENELRTAFFPDKGSDSDSVFRNLAIFEVLDPLAGFINRLPSLFPEKAHTAKIQAQTYRDYGRAVKKTTIILDGTELTTEIRKNTDLSALLNAQGLSGLFFEGRQSFSLFLSEDDKFIMLSFSGHAGTEDNDLRNVRLEWKTVRSDSLEKDELQLRTPDAKGTRRNNLLLTYVWKSSEDSAESVQWTAEFDRVRDRIRTRIFDEAQFSVSNGAISGKLNEKAIIGTETTYREGILSSTLPEDGRCKGTLEINHKKDKIETDRILFSFELFPGDSMQVASVTPEILETDSSAFNVVLETLYDAIVREFLKLPDKDLALFRDELPDRLWEEIHAGQE